MILQIVVTLGVLVLVLPNMFSAYKKQNLTLFGFITWAIFWTFGLLIIWIEDLIVYIGNFFGVERSIDALVYLSILFLLYAYVKQKIRLNEMNKEITTLVRRLALKDIKDK